MRHVLPRGIAASSAAQNMPHGHQELAGDGHHGFVLAQTRFESFQFCLPVGVAANRRVGCFDHRAPDVTAPGFGDPSCTAGLATVMHAGA